MILYAGNMFGNTSNDPFTAYQEAAKVMSAKKGSASRTVSGDDLMITGSRLAATVKIELYALVQTKKSRGGSMETRSSQRSVETARSVGSLATALSDLNLQVFPQDGTNLPSGEPLEIVQVLQGGLLRVRCSAFDLFLFRFLIGDCGFRADHLPAVSFWRAVVH